ncbi:MAG: hypothetical protein Q8Q20_05860 [bacterium]|nr:hypothetical protein [bacterium]
MGTKLHYAIGQFVVVFFAAELVTCGFEWFFHRYILHSILLNPLRKTAIEHRRHHRLTPGRDFPITKPEQHEAEAFPWWALSAFYLVFAPAIVGVQMLFPSWPILLGGFTAVTWSMCFYEVAHHCQHRPLAWWQRFFRLPLLGPAIRAYYLDHLMHHIHVKSNEAISGFFCGFPLADYMLGTHHRPASLQPDGTCSNNQDLRIGRPVPLVRWLDTLASHREARSKLRERC